MNNLTEVTFASSWTDPAGVVHEGGTTVKIPAPTARDLILRGKARLADTATAVQPDPVPPPAASTALAAEGAADAVSDTPPITEPAGSVKPATTKSRSKNKEVVADD